MRPDCSLWWDQRLALSVSLSLSCLCLSLTVSLLSLSVTVCHATAPTAWKPQVSACPGISPVV